MRQLFDRWTAWIVDVPWLSTSVLAVITAFAVLGYRDPDVFRRWWVQGQGGEVATSNEFEQVDVPNVDPFNLTRAEAVIVVESEGFFTPEGAKALRGVVERLEALDYVREIVWMDRVPILNIFGLPEPLFPRAEASQERFDAAREKALAHPLVKGQLLAPDGRLLLLMVHFDWLFVTSDADVTAGLRQAAEAASAQFPDVPMEFSVTGYVPLRLTAMQQHEANQVRYQLIGYGMIAVMALVLFRGITAVLIVAMAPALGVFWTLGLLRFFDLQDNPFNDVVLPVLLSLVGLTDGVHLMVQIRRLRVEGRTEKDAAREGIREVGLACALTSLTTAIGFGSLSLAHHQVVREFGWCCVLGVVMTFCSVVIVIPLVCSTWLGRRVHAGYEKGMIDRHLARIGGLVDLVLKRPVAIGLSGVAVTVFLTIVSLGLRPDERNSNQLPSGCEPVLAMEKMDRALGGLEMGRVDVTWSQEVASDSPEVLQVVSAVDDLLRSEELIGHPLSIRSLIDAMPGEGKPADRMSLLELLPPPLKRAFYVPETRQAEVLFRVQDLGIAKYGPVFERVEFGLQEIAQKYPEFHLDLSGSAVWRWENLYQIVVDLATSLGSAIVIIFFVLAIAYRSVRIGLISLVPNLFPLAITGAFLMVTGQSLEVVSVCAFTICLGIAVDDTIHFLTRFREEQQKTGDQQLAIRRAFVGVGTALIMTTLILVSGFSVVLFSGLRDHRIFAAMGALTISSALFGDLVFLPALLSAFVKPEKPAESAVDPVDAAR
jgi:predicted RND superfamily exporter protein